MVDEDRPASPEDEELAEFFDAEDAPEDRMTFSAFDGFATGIALAPEEVPQAAWVAIALGEAEERVPSRIVTLMAQHVEKVRAIFDAGEGAQRFSPVFDLLGEEDGEELVSPSDWCAGFLIATEFYRETLDALAESDDDVADLLTPIVTFGTDEGLDTLEADEDGEELADQLIDAIQPNVVRLAALLRAGASDNGASA